MAAYIVVDASVAGAWLFAETFSTKAQSVWDAVEKHRVNALVPDRFAEEMLRVCQKKTLPPPVGELISPANAWNQYLEVITSPIVFLPSNELHERAWELAFTAGLTTYDALYLALAERWEAELWTLDDLLCGSSAAAYATVRDLRTQVFPH
jgi:predicted nucleic acid-binding protein